MTPFMTRHRRPGAFDRRPRCALLVVVGTTAQHAPCRRFAAFLKRSPDTAGAEDIRRFQLHLGQS